MQDAIIAIEDARFYNHRGIDPAGLLRAVYRNIRSGKVVEGGSTITQQLAKNVYLEQNRTAGRKIREIFLAVQLERNHTKREILEIYLNRIYFSQGAYGIEARIYFDKPASGLSLAESAMLAGIPRAPSACNPISNFSEAKRRQSAVLDRMAELGMISRERAQAAKSGEVRLLQKPFAVKKAPYFTSEIVREFEKDRPCGSETLYSDGLSIYTTLDLKIQEAAEKVLSEGLNKYNRDLEGALVAIDPRTGEIRAMVGSNNHGESQLNRSLAKVQLGSAFKPVLYAAALEKGYTAGTTIICEPANYQLENGSYEPEDFHEGCHNRPFTLKEALYTSDNIVAVKLNRLVGPSVTAAYAKKWASIPT
ncbi:MAG TPA: transglycosylase domain-containing protein [Bacillota bacterium]|nr:transglycosylase domain-containing protein [Bacillota bacterium]